MKLSLVVDHACNLRCTYCYAGHKVRRPMPWAVARQAVEFGFAQSVKPFLVIAFFGGEPLLHVERLERIIGYAMARAAEYKKAVYFSVATNGTLLGQRRLQLLTRPNVFVQVSLDGGAAAQDRTRRYAGGRSSWRQVVANVRTLHTAGVRPRIVTVLDPAQVEYLGAGFDEIADLGSERIQLAPNFSGCWDEAACQRFETALFDLEARWMKRFRKGRYVELAPLSSKIAAHIRGAHRPRRCRFGVEELAVAPSGRIYPCDRLVRQDDNPATCIGRLDSGIDTVRRDAAVQAKDRVDSECLVCPLNTRCQRGCGCINYETTGDIGQTGSLLCYFERCFIASADRVAAALYAERNATFLNVFYGADSAEAVLPAAQPFAKS